MNKAERLIDLIAMLLEARRPVTLERIRNSIPGYQQASVASFKRMFERDKSELREMGVPIRVEPVDPFGEEMGYRIAKEEYYLPEIDFTPEEKVALLLVNRLASGGMIPLSREAGSALLKLSPDLGDVGRTDRTGYAPLRFVHPAESLEALTKLWEASVKRRTVRFTYRSLGSSRSQERSIDPYGLYFDRGAWYVVGYCHLRGEVRSFRVSRIESEVETTTAADGGPDFERPKDFRLREHARILPWEFEEGTQYRAEVRFSPRIAWLVERDLGDIYPFRSLKGGGGKLRVTVRNEEAFCNWVLSFAEDAEVLSPPELRRKVKERLLEIMSTVGGEEGG
ncbi:MAG: YafY family transcriptional regulator [Actinobacteria bacterium]|nr:YafY family transcriptional regulator [Actinomycetota bacterium]